MFRTNNRSRVAFGMAALSASLSFLFRFTPASPLSSPAARISYQRKGSTAERVVFTPNVRLRGSFVSRQRVSARFLTETSSF